ncbi:MAG: hybrid sensor histidine kinase/response regulator [Thermodesulfobacteriota bacterium]|nr:hybrid sensor histidine kinase/response regulator [Thermodesulfobacteriota bacterium]
MEMHRGQLHSQTRKANTVLFVDDEQNVLNALRRLLRAEPYESLFAQGGREALDFLDTTAVHVIVTDLTMPGMDGFKLLKLVEMRHPEVVRLVLSARGDRDSVFDAIKCGGLYRYILKPWDAKELKSIVRQAIDVFNLQEEKRNLVRELEEHNHLLEKRVEERTKQLVALERQAEIGKYSAQIVHNLNNPLQAIFGYSELSQIALCDQEPDLDDLEGNVCNIISNAKDLKEIISGVLVHARNEDPHKTGEVDVNAVIRKTLDFYELDPLFEKETEKHFDLSDGLPLIMGHQIQIRQIVDNLVKNAIDAMEHCEEKRLTIETHSAADAVVIRVSDTGEGIQGEDLDRIYSPDYTTKPVGKGTGLGLASVKTMVDAYSGSIQVETTPGAGTTFTVIIPSSPPAVP